MLKLKDKLDVLMRHKKYGEGIREIARKTGISRNTVRDYIREFDDNHRALVEKDPGIDQVCIQNRQSDPVKGISN